MKLDPNINFSKLGAFSIAVFCLIAYVFMPSTYPVLYLAVAFFAIGMGKVNITLDRYLLLWILAALAIFVGAVHSTTNGLKFAIAFSLLIICLICLNNTEHEWRKTFVMAVALFSFVHIVATFVQFLYPSIIDSLNSRILTSEQLYENLRLVNRFGAYAGITGQTARNGWFISLALGIIIVNLLQNNPTHKRKLILLALAVIAYIALILTHKRSFIVIPIFCVIILLFVQGKIKPKNFFKIMLVIGLIAVIYNILCENIPEISIAMARFDVDDTGDYTTGRAIRWINTWNVFTEHLIFGVGLLNIPNYTHTGYSHNSYLQILAEIGFVGGVLVILAMVVSLLNSIRIYKHISDSNQYFSLLGIYYQVLFLAYAMVGNPLTDIQMVALYIISIALCYFTPNEYTLNE